MYSHHYIIYGLRIASNQDVAGLSSQSFDGLPDVRLEILGAGTWTFTPIPDELLLNGVKRMEEQWHSLKGVANRRNLARALPVDRGTGGFRHLHCRGSCTSNLEQRFSCRRCARLLPRTGDRLRAKTEGSPCFTCRCSGRCSDSAIAILGNKGAGKSTLLARLRPSRLPNSFGRRSAPILPGMMTSFGFIQGIPVYVFGPPPWNGWGSSIFTTCRGWNRYLRNDISN